MHKNIKLQYSFK